MRGLDLARHLTSLLPDTREGIFNPWRSRCEQDLFDDASAQRLDRLGRHLDCEAEFLAFGEGQSYQGARYSGIAFTAEKMVMAGAIPRIPATARLTRRGLPFSEPSGTIVWRTLHALGIAERTVLWNALHVHPHLPGEIWTNRTPTPAEFQLGAAAALELRRAFSNAKVVAVGRHAGTLLRSLGVDDIDEVRHPARGGATLFAEGMRALVQG